MSAASSSLGQPDVLAADVADAAAGDRGVDGSRASASVTSSRVSMKMNSIIGSWPEL